MTRTDISLLRARWSFAAGAPRSVNVGEITSSRSLCGRGSVQRRCRDSGTCRNRCAPQTSPGYPEMALEPPDAVLPHRTSPGLTSAPRALAGTGFPRGVARVRTEARRVGHDPTVLSTAAAIDAPTLPDSDERSRDDATSATADAIGHRFVQVPARSIPERGRRPRADC